MQLRLADWVFAFVHGFRYESSKLKPEETKCFEPYVKEQMLTKPCQVEVIQFSKPYRLALLFFFDETKQDLLIHIYQEKWNNLDATVTKLLNKYSALQLNHKDLHRLLKRCRSHPNKLIYAIDFITNVGCICFTHDVRIKVFLSFSWPPHYITDPQEMAELIFNLNHCQAVDAVVGEEILEMAAKELTKHGHKIVKKLTKGKDGCRGRSSSHDD